MKIKATYILALLLSADIEIQAPPKNQKKGRAIVTAVETLQEPYSYQPCSAASSEMPSPKNSAASLAVSEQHESYDDQEEVISDPENMMDIGSAAAAASSSIPQGLPAENQGSSAQFRLLGGEVAKSHLTLEEVTERDLLNRLRQDYPDWDTTTDQEAASTKQPPQPLQKEERSWLTMLTDAPKAFWQNHITDENRMERLARQVGIKTYDILYLKHQQGTLKAFILSLNESSKASEGYNWLEDGVRQAIQDEKEEKLRAILDPGLSPHLTLRQITRELATTYLQHCGAVRKADFEKDAIALKATIELLHKESSPERELKGGVYSESD
ncbi:MAG: hypothetical protein NTZ68_00880 [Candidatus Dependentiae bacterium]|nr:hypothetical protein [Candidatus Dependentiae bacterium]